MRLAPALVAALALATGAAAGAQELRRPDPAASYPAKAQSLAWAGAFSDERLALPDGGGLPYRLLRPEGERLPLVIVLHGSGAIGADNVAQMGGFAASWAEPGVATARRAIVAVPQVPVRSADYETGADGLPASRAGRSLAVVRTLVAHLAKDPRVDPDRIYLVGFSMGGSAALNLLSADPEIYAAAVAFAPVPPPREQAGALAGASLMLVHGDADTENPFAADLAWVKALEAAGGKPRLLVYEGMDHRVPPELITATDDWRAWLFAQTRQK